MEFELSRASAAAWIVPLVVTTFCPALASLFGWIAWSSTHASVSVVEDGMRLNVPMYGRTVGFDQMDLDAADVVSLERDSPLRPVGRTNGIGIPGFGVGWFKLADGSRALFAVTGRSRVVRVPTRLGYAVFVSAAEPERLLEQLRARAVDR